jgi:Lrp/AsnC ligand binding domain
MLLEAYVLVQTTDGSGPIADDIRAIRGVSFAEDLRGPYAAIVRTCRSAAAHLEKIVAEIRRLPGVTRAVTSPLLMPIESVRDDAA